MPNQDLAKFRAEDLPPTDLKYDERTFKKLAKKVREEHGHEVTAWETYVTIILSLHQLREQMQGKGAKVPSSDMELQALVKEAQRKP